MKFKFSGLGGGPCIFVPSCPRSLAGIHPFRPLAGTARWIPATNCGDDRRRFFPDSDQSPSQFHLTLPARRNASFYKLKYGETLYHNRHFHLQPRGIPAFASASPGMEGRHRGGRNFHVAKCSGGYCGRRARPHVVERIEERLMERRTPCQSLLGFTARERKRKGPTHPGFLNTEYSSKS